MRIAFGGLSQRRGSATLRRAVLVDPRNRAARTATALSVVGAVILAGCGGSSSTRRTSSHRAGTTAPRAQHRSAPVAVALRYRALYSLASALQDPGSASLGNGRFVLMGGLDAADTSTSGVIVGDGHGVNQVASLPNKQHDAQAATLGGRVYLFGGGQFSTYDHILAYDPASSSVSTVGTLPSPSSDVAVAGDGATAYVAGGYDGTNWLTTILSYTPGQGIRVAGHLPVGLRYAVAAMAGNALIIAGGSTPSGAASNAIYRFDPAGGQVRQIGTLPQAITHAGGATLNGLVYVVGGRGASTDSKTASIWAVNPVTGRVRPAGQLPQPLSDPGVVGIGSAIVVAGGSSAAGTQSTVGELTPAG